MSNTMQYCCINGSPLVCLRLLNIAQHRDDVHTPATLQFD